MSNPGRFQSAKNLQPARSLRTPGVNRNGPGNFPGLPIGDHRQHSYQLHQQQQQQQHLQYNSGQNGYGLPLHTVQHRIQNNGSNGNGHHLPYNTGNGSYNGYRSPSGSYNGSQKSGVGQRRHDVLRSANNSFGSNVSLASSQASSGREISTIVTFSSTSMPVGSLQEVYVSYVENGPKLFSVQLKSTENVLNQMMRTLENVTLRNLSRKPTLGMACIARFSGDQMLYRALIMGINVESCLVSYVDYGNSETVEFKNLYEIPSEFLKHKVFSMRFTLSNVKALEDTNADIAEIFSSLVLDKLLTMKVMPLEGPAFVQYCELYDQKENIFQKLIELCKSKPLKYPAAITLDKASSYMVIIRYVDSCGLFYVQPVEIAGRFEQLMDNLAEFSRKSPPLAVVNVGDPCVVCLDGIDFYRAEIASVTGSKVKVHMVDYGNTITVQKSQLKRISKNFVEQQPQVAACCLEGFQGDDDSMSTSQLEMLAENQSGERIQLKLVVLDIIDGLALVNLFDESSHPTLNVSKRLLKLKNPAKFIKEQQQLQQKGALGSNRQSHQQGNHQPQSPPATASSAVNNNRNPFFTSTAISEVTNISQITPPRIQHESEVIDLTADDQQWPSSAPPMGHQSSGYEQQQASAGTHPSSAVPTTGSASYRTAAGSPGNRGGRDSHNSSRSSDSNSSNKKERSQRADIPRFAKDRNQTPYYVEHDDRCTTATSYDQWEKPGAQQKNRYNASGSESGFKTQSTERSNTSQDSFKPPTTLSDTGEDYVEFDHGYIEQVIPMNTKMEIKLSWWISPDEFYIRLKDEEAKFDEMMKQIQKFYRNKSSLSGEVPPVGSVVVSRYQKNNTFYRARIVKYNEALNKFKLELVDCGMKTIVTGNDLWKLDRRFTKLPKLVVQCGLANVKMNCDIKDLQNQIDKYIDNDRPIECVFLEKSDDKFVCDVDVQGSDLKMMLLKDNLITQILTDVDLQRLKGQTLKLKLIEMKGLDLFRVKILGTDAILNCCHVEHGAYEPSLVEEIQSRWLDQYCYGQVEDVSGDEKLILSLLVSPLSSTVPPTIVEMPILQNTFHAMVTHVQEVNCVYVQNSKWGSDIAKLLDDLYDYYESNGEPITNLQMNELCASKASDGNWYRAKIVSLQEIENIEVLFVDYGNRERVKHEDLKVLEAQFREQSAFANRVYLPLACLNDGEEDKLKLEIAQLTGEFELELKVLDYRNDIWIVDIASNDYSIVQVLKDKQLAKDLDHEEILNQKTTVIIESVTDVAEEKLEEERDGQKYQKQKAFVSHVDNPNQLFIQMSSDVEDLDQLQENLQIIAQALPPLKDFSVNRHCIAPYSADELWYRAKIIDSHDDLIIQFVDYGNSDVITSNKKCDLKDVNDSLMKFKIYAKQCSLIVSPASGKKSWNEEATSILRDLSEVEVQFLAESQGVHYINISTEDRDLGEDLISKNLAMKMEFVPSGQRCFTSHIESIHEFYLQLERDVAPLDLMADYMARFDQFSTVTNPKVGCVYLAEYPEDNLWYRVKILDVVDSGKYEAFFLDYGNTSTVINVRELETSIAELPRLCTKCSLKLPEGVKMWSDEAETKFREISAMGETVYTVQLHSPGTVATIELFLDGININDQLMDLCEKGASSVMNSSFYLSDEKTLDDSCALEGHVIVSHTNSPADFYIQFKNSFDALKNMEELLMSKATQCERLTHDEIYEGMYCLAYLVSYDKYYRSQIISINNHQYKVLLIDYGFTSFATDLRKMPTGIENISLLAKKCCLEMYNPNESVLDVVKKRFAALVDGGRVAFSFEIVRNDCDPTIVRLFTEDNRNVEDIIETEDPNLVIDAIDNNTSTQPTHAVAPPPPTPADLIKTSARAKPKQAFFRAKSDLEFEQ